MTRPPEVEERARALREALHLEAWTSASGMFDDDEILSDILRAIVTELGITQEMVDVVGGGSAFQPADEPIRRAAADALSVLLAAGGSE